MLLTRPAALWLLLLVLPLLLLERARIIRLLPAIRAVWGNSAAASWRSRKIRSAALRALSLIALALALSGPVSGLKVSRSWTSRLDVALLLDVSRSMNVSEGGSTRLERAKREARSLMDGLPSGRFALCVFKGGAMTVFPLTDDWEAIDEFLDSAGSHLMTEKGSDIEAGVREALGALRTKSGSARAVVLLSDGESLSGNVNAAAEAARAAGTPIHAVGMGSDQGGAVPENETVRSRRNRTTLKLLCQSSGGAYADEENRSAVRAIIERLEAPLSPRGGRTTSLERRDGSSPFILLCCLSLALSALAGMYPSAGAAGEGGRGRKAVVLSFISICLCAFLGCERSQAVLGTVDGLALASRGEQPRAIERFLKVLPRVSGTDADTVRYDLALCYSAMGEQEAALDLMERAASSKSEKVAAQAWYSLGCFHFMAADYRKAWESFRECLKLEPGEPDAQVNLELSWERIERDAGAVSRQSSASGRTEGLEGESEEFELIRQTERDRFRNAQETEAESGANDY